MAKTLWDSTDCQFSADRLYRYTLTRYFPPIGRKGKVCFFMLNPSTADETKDDRTVRRCVGFAHDWGYLTLDVLNAFAYRDKNPKVLRKVADPIGPEYDKYVLPRLKQMDLVICAWGSDPAMKKRQPEMLDLIRKAGKVPHYLEMTDTGYPGHPLYLKADLKPQPFAA